MVQLILLAMSVPASASFGLATDAPWCSIGYRFDSYGAGVAAGMTRQDDRPELIDEGCYTLGKREAADARRDDDVFDCEGDYRDGYRRGNEGDVQYAGSRCTSLGYSAGAAALHIGARESRGSVGRDCIDEYRRGLSDANQNYVATYRYGNRLNACYGTGYLDGQMF